MPLYLLTILGLEGHELAWSQRFSFLLYKNAIPYPHRAQLATGTESNDCNAFKKILREPRMGVDSTD